MGFETILLIMRGACIGIGCVAVILLFMALADTAMEIRQVSLNYDFIRAQPLTEADRVN